MSAHSNPYIQDLAALLLTFLILFALVYFSRESRMHSPEAFVSEEEVVLYLRERIGLDQLVNELHAIGVRFDEEELRWSSSILGWRNFNPGRYEIGGSYSYSELLSKFALGLQDHASVTIPPGINIERLVAVLDRDFMADAAHFATLFSDSSSLAEELDLTPESLFARMLPDTYNFYWTTNPERVILRIYQEFERRIAARFEAEISAHPLELDELITLASIVEWEAAHNEEKPTISGLYLNRLNRNMRLQADPTVVYALGEHRRLLFEDYQLDHPYNTYLIRGLPPGPITNPDRYSLEAAIQPEEHDFLYMVASPQGGHVFSRTFEEHRLASSEWRRWIQEQYRIRQQREAEEQR